MGYTHGDGGNWLKNNLTKDYFFLLLFYSAFCNGRSKAGSKELMDLKVSFKLRVLTGERRRGIIHFFCFYYS